MGQSGMCWTAKHGAWCHPASCCSPRLGQRLALLQISHRYGCRCRPFLINPITDQTMHIVVAQTCKSLLFLPLLGRASL